MKKTFRHIQGMTLVEMMVVVAIMGILAVIGLPSYQSYVERTNLADSKRIIAGLYQSIEADKLTKPSDFKDKNKVKAIIDGRISGLSATARGKYNYSSAIGENGKVLTIYLQAVPTELQGKKYFLWADGNSNVLRCKLSGSPSEVSATKPSNCENF